MSKFGKYHFWIFKNGSDGVRFQLDLDRLLNAKTVAFGLIAFVGLAAFLFSKEGPLAPTKFTKGDYDEQVELLADELIKVKNYEAVLKKKSSRLDAALEGIKKSVGNSKALDKASRAIINSSPSTVAVSSLFGAERAKAKFNSWSGVGGYIEPELPLPESGVGKPLSRFFPGGATETNLADKLTHQLALVENLPIGLPTTGALTSHFGKRRSPFTGRWQQHKGIDFAAPTGTPIFTTADGVVTQAGYKAGYGLSVVLKHKGGFETLYGHLSKIKVTVGQKVCREQEIALMGSTGRSTGPHLHYEVRLNGKKLNPMAFVESQDLLTAILAAEAAEQAVESAVSDNSMPQEESAI